ncbi:DUF4065 domain-containing protein [Virgibacillus salarius]|uniref:type II TA system antitoxin MqsA family protein n=1 Tax=Virgibacillus salarius TaxID=447199 RepID=UPI00248F6613|nr:type II TA system antitoxin MqsA family protein [Virgibacillus salarius]WBX81274.1 DUF4065 domain-containing protein [Virgibacillus salarius]
MFKNMFCTCCLEEVEASKINTTEIFDIKGEKIQVESTYYKCPVCDELMYDNENPSENINKAYNEYRNLKNILKPEEIIDIREKYNLSQRQLAKLLGWGHATISKYESGALPSINHNNTLVLLKNSNNVSELLDRNKENFTVSEYKKIKAKVDSYVEENKSNFIFTLMESIFYSVPNELTGYKKFNMDKVIQMVKFFASKDERLFKMRLIKFLFYADFLNFKRYTTSISGLKYKHLPMGPVPDEYDLLLDFVTKSGEVNKEFIDISGYDNQGERFYAIGEFNETLFDIDEIQTLEDVYEKLKYYNSRDLSDLSHTEDAWKCTNHVEIISYKYGESLSID